MNDLLWAQTEPKSQVLIDGEIKECDAFDYISVERNPKYIRITNNQMKVFFNKTDKSIVIHGHVEDLDAAGRKIPFAFFMSEKNIFKVASLLKIRLACLRLTPPNETLDGLLQPYVNQNIIPFLTKKKLYTTLLLGLLGLICFLLKLGTK
ncbi:MAG: hypothetical protein IKZ45_10475 [Fibrobacter sp.]|nr:hypothetical protein [Fibrobacter sp.]